MSLKKKLSKKQFERKLRSVLEQARSVSKFRMSRERDALIKAIRYGESDIAHALLKNGFDPSAIDLKGKSALWHALHCGHTSVVKDLMARGAKLPDDALMGPVQQGNAQLVKFLIRRGANVNCVATYTRNNNYKFPQREVLLTVAIKNISTHEFAEKAAQALRSIKTARWRGAHPPGSNDGDSAEIAIALIKAGTEINRLAYTYALYQGFIRTLLCLAAHRGYEKIVKAMIAAGADVNKKDTWGGTALFDAAMAGHSKVVKMLLKAGAKTDIERREGGTPAAIARRMGFHEIADEIEHCNR